MRLGPRGAPTLFTLALLACGGDGSNEPEPPFPDAAGVYELSGSFDDIPVSEASFEGTLELTQASQASGDLEGSATILAEIGSEIFAVSDDDLADANVSPSGVISFTMADPSGSWTFSGTLSDNTITDGRHTLSAGDQSFSGDWQATRTSGATALEAVARPVSLAEMMRRLTP